MTSGGGVSLSPDMIRIRAFVSRVGKPKSRGHPWLHDFQVAVFTDSDLDHALVTDDTTLAKNALAAISYRLYHDDPPGPIRISLGLLGVDLR